MTRSERHLQVLVEAFRGLAGEYTWHPADVREYPTPGDPGRCTCGHPIRVGYVWRHADGHAVELGSDCTTQVPGLDERFAALVVADALERAKVEAAEARRRAREERDAPLVAECLALGVEADRLDTEVGELLKRVSDTFSWNANRELGERSQAEREAYLDARREVLRAGNDMDSARRHARPADRRRKLNKAIEHLQVARALAFSLQHRAPQLP
jgi:hypothetical protein